MSTARAPARRAPHPLSAADNATAPSTPEASRPESAQGSPAAHEATEPDQRAAPPGHPARRPSPVDWPAHLARLDELRSDTGALPRGALAALADELGVKAGTVYSQMSRRRRDEALREQGRAAALTHALPQYADPTCNDPESQAPAPAQTSPQARHQPHDRPAGTRHAVLQRLDSEEAVLAATYPPAAAHRVELRCPGCAALLTLALADRAALTEPELIHSGSPLPTQAPTLDPTEPGLAPNANPSTPEPCPRKTSP